MRTAAANALTGPVPSTHWAPLCIASLTFTELSPRAVRQFVRDTPRLPIERFSTLPQLRASCIDAHQRIRLHEPRGRGTPKLSTQCRRTWLGVSAVVHTPLPSDPAYRTVSADGQAHLKMQAKRVGRSAGLFRMISLGSFGGESGIRTHGTLSRTHAFQACALNHSAISP